MPARRWAYMTKVPHEIPHVRENYVTLEHLIGALVKQSYSELQNILRTLPSVPSDLARKREFLGYIVQTRQQFVKLYVLCKWAVVAPDISRCIDVANWLRGQQNCFNNVVSALYHLQLSMGAAKLQHADIETALQVLKHGSPVQPSFGFLAPRTIGAGDVLQVLQNLNVLLAIRLALVEKLPPVYRNYSIRNGRARFTVTGSFWIDLGVADDKVDARFFYVDFGLDLPKTVSAATSRRLEVWVNEKLAANPLAKVLDWVLHFSSNCKLQLVSRDLLQMQKCNWAGTLKHTFNVPKSLIAVTYWDQKIGSFQLQIGISTSHQLQVNWLVNGDYLSLPEHVLGPFETDLDASALMFRLTRYHSERLVDAVSLPWIERSGDAQLILNFSQTRNSILNVDCTSGKITLTGSNPLVQRAQTMLNELKDLSVATDLLERVRLGVLQETIAHRATAAGWQARPSLRLASGELAKFGDGAKMLLCLRLKQWAEGWFVTIALGDSVKWMAAQMGCSQKRWHVDTLHDLGLATSDPDYGVFAKLADICTQQFTMYQLCCELDKAGIRYQQGRTKLQLVVDLRTVQPSASAWANSGLVLEVGGQKLKLQGCALKGALDGVGPLDEDGIKLGADGIFTILLDRTEHLLPQIEKKLGELDRLASWLRLAHRHNFEVRSAGIHKFELGYTPNRSTMGMLSIENDRVTLEDDNPQHMLTPFLPSLLARGGLPAVVEVLTVSYPLYETVTRLGCVAVPHSITTLVILNSLNTGNEAPHLLAQLRSWRGKSMIYLTANESVEKNEKLVKLFEQPSLDGCVPLRKGMAVPLNKIEELLEIAVSALKQAVFIN